MAKIFFKNKNLLNAFNSQNSQLIILQEIIDKFLI